MLGLLIEGEGVAAHVLQDLGATLDKVRAEIQRLLADGHEGRISRPSPSLSPDIAAALDAAGDLAGLEGAEKVGPEHLLLTLAAAGTAVGEYLARGGALSDVGNEITPLAKAVREARAAKQEAVERQDHEAAARHYRDEQESEDRLSQAMAAFRSGLH